MAKELEKVIEENGEEIVAQTVTEMKSQMSTYEALPVEEIRRRVGILIDTLHEALVRNERQIRGDFVCKMVGQRLEEGYPLAQIQHVIRVAEHVLRGVIVGACKQDPHAVGGAKSRFVEGIMFDTRAAVDTVCEKRSAEVVNP